MKLPRHEAGLYISHNDHKASYCDAERWLSLRNCDYEWQSEEAKKRAIDTDSIWTLQWYPNTPDGFNIIAAPTFKELLEYAAELEDLGDYA